MLKTTTIAACVLALSGGVALAQMNPMPPGPNAAPGGAGGSAPATSIGNPSANAQDTVGGSTRSTTVLSQTNKNQSAAGMSRSDYSSGAQVQYGTQPMAPNQAQGGMMAPSPSPTNTATSTTAAATRSVAAGQPGWRASFSFLGPRVRSRSV